ncbi:coil containing protein [Vibrio phage 1.036.O._10N.286.45.C3]|nr:coil containing protein [Vibrio phage 1.036.O._10N.286.45.C3]
MIIFKRYQVVELKSSEWAVVEFNEILFEETGVIETFRTAAEAQELSDELNGDNQ